MGTNISPRGEKNWKNEKSGIQGRSGARRLGIRPRRSGEDTTLMMAWEEEKGEKFLWARASLRP